MDAIDVRKALQIVAERLISHAGGGIGLHRDEDSWPVERLDGKLIVGCSHRYMSCETPRNEVLWDFLRSPKTPLSRPLLLEAGSGTVCPGLIAVGWSGSEAVATANSHPRQNVGRNSSPDPSMVPVDAPE